ncbi:hypothetical protein S40288_06904 [Stachybotrys chartarum IBT 40288]|nr:hypothetical protein S40288_06904 [Stachybotrys chartarum IBT 40288]
MAKTLETVT